MQWLAGWVRDLVIIVFFVSIAYMLLPENHLRQYARMVMGLIVIAALLTPMLDLMRLDPTGFDAFGTGESASMENIIAHGRFIAEEARYRLTEEGRSRGVEHVASVVELALGAAPMELDVTWLADGSIERLFVTVARHGEQPPDVERAARLIAGYFGLRREQVNLRSIGSDEQGGAAH